MVDIGGDSAPDPNTMGLVFQSYASFKAVKESSKLSKSERKGLAEVGPAPALSGQNDGPSIARGIESDSKVATGAIRQERNPPSGLLLSDLLGDSTLFYPGPLPRTSEEVVIEARNLLEQCLGKIDMYQQGSAPTLAAHSDSSQFPAVFPTPFLLDSYLLMLGEHAPFTHFIDFYRNAFRLASVPKTRFVYEQAIHRCGRAKNRDVGLAFAREVFKEWQDWDGGVLAGETDDDGHTSKAVARHTGKTGRNISRMWGSMIRNLAR
jgi:hypothetical protein